MKPQGFPRSLRLQQRREFLRVQRRGEKHHTRHFLVFIAPRLPSSRAADKRKATGLALVSAAVSKGEPREVTADPPAQALQPTRVGVTVTRKVGAAHQRNRIKRLVREVFRQERLLLVPGYDMVWVAKRNAVETTLESLRTDFQALARRLKRRTQPDSTAPDAVEPT